MTEQEFLKSAGLEKKTTLRGRTSWAMSIGEHLANWLRSRRSKGASSPETWGTHEQDERSKQLWATHSKEQLQQPRHPMDMLR